MSVVLFGVLLLGGLAFLIMTRSGESDYVLTRWQLRQSTGAPDGVLAEVAGRRAGLVSFVLTALRISPTFSMTVRQDATYFTLSDIQATVTRIIPHQKVSHVTSGYSRPIREATIIYIVLMMGFGGVGVALDNPALVILVFLIAFGVAAAVLMLGRRLSLVIAEDSGRVVGFRFKPSVVEGVNVDETRVTQLTEVVRSVVLRSLGTDPGSMQVVVEATSAPVPPAPTHPVPNAQASTPMAQTAPTQAAPPASGGWWS